MKPENSIDTEHLHAFDQIRIEEMGMARLQDRKETKYIFHQGQLFELLEMIKRDSFLFVTEQKFFQRYSTRYYDTADFALYLGHHNGILNRYKNWRKKLRGIC